MMTEGRKGREGVPPAGRAVGMVAYAVFMVVSLHVVPPGWAGGQEMVTAAPPAEALTLPQAVEMALERSRDVRDARFGLELAREQVSEAWGSVLPTLDLSASYTRNLTRPTTFMPAFFDPDASPDDLVQVRFGADNSWNASLNLQQPLFDPRAFIGLGTAGRFASLQEELVRGRAQNAVTRVRMAFYDVLLAQEQERLTTNSVQRVRRSFKETQALNLAGLASDYDVLRLEVELANLEPNLRRAENATTQFRRVLAVELALPDQESLTVAGSLASMDLDDPAANSPPNRAILGLASSGAMEVDVEGRLALAQERRSDIRQLELAEDLRHAEMRLEQVQYLPTVSLVGNYVLQAQQNGGPDFFGDPGSRASAQAVGVMVSMPVFEGFRKDARIDQRRTVLRQAEVQTRLARDQAESEVKAFIELAEEARLRARGQRLAVDQARRGFEIASAQYREGISDQLELTDAEVALRQSEFNYAQAVYDYLVAWARLDEAVGAVPMVDTELARADGE